MTLTSASASRRGTTRRSLFTLDPSLSEAVDPGQRDVARRALHAAVIEAPVGSLELGNEDPRGCVGYLVSKGLLVRNVKVMGSQSTEPLGPGDLVRPWQEDAVSFAESEFVALTPATLARLDRDLVGRAAHFPGLIEALLDRAMQRARFMAVSAAIDGLVGVDRRVSALMWALAERWGEIRDGAVFLPLELQHEALAGLVAARRPSVSTALLSSSGRGGLSAFPVGGGFTTSPRTHRHSGDPPASPLRRPELRQLPIRARGWGRQGRRRSARPQPVAGAAREPSGDAVSRPGGHRSRRIALRYGGFYGAANDGLVEPVRKRQFSLVGGGGGISSFVHLAAAAAATVLALERDAAGIYNIVDDDPAPASEWLPVLANALGAKPPRRVPRWLARSVAGEAAVMIGTEARGASNAKGKRDPRVALRYPSWRQASSRSTGQPPPPAPMEAGVTPPPEGATRRLECVSLGKPDPR